MLLVKTIWSRLFNLFESEDSTKCLVPVVSKLNKSILEFGFSGSRFDSSGSPNLNYSPASEKLWDLFLSPVTYLCALSTAALVGFITGVLYFFRLLAGSSGLLVPEAFAACFIAGVLGSDQFGYPETPLAITSNIVTQQHWPFSRLRKALQDVARRFSRCLGLVHSPPMAVPYGGHDCLHSQRWSAAALLGYLGQECDTRLRQATRLLLGFMAFIRAAGNAWWEARGVSRPCAQMDIWV